MNPYLGIDIGGTKCAIVLGDEACTTLERHAFPTPRGPAAALAQLTELAQALIARHGPVAAVGISCGGPLNAPRGLILSPPNLPDWDHVAVTQHFSDHLGVPAFLQNDANAGALAEWQHGAGRGSQNLMFCTMGTGFGAGLILDGRLLNGTNGNAGEIGHLRLTPDGPIGYGKAGSVEGWCSGGGIAQLAQLRLGRTLSAKDLAEAADRDDPAALALFDEVGTKLGHTLALSIDLLNLDTIVLGSIFARAERFLRPAMSRVLVAECLPPSLAVCTIKPAELGDRIGDVAALTVAQVGLASAH
jgi:glucokinase